MTLDVLELDGMSIPVDTSGTNRNARLTIERDGSLYLRAAADVADDELRRFVNGKREWIYRKLAEKEDLHREPVAKELVDGEGFSYLGRSYRLRVAEDGDTRVRLRHGRLVLPRRRLDDGHAAIIGWYEATGRAWLRPRVRDWSNRLRVEPDRLDVADLGHKWGSATATGRVRIHWAAMQLNAPLVDYVLVHELAHLREPHHGPAFWRLLGLVMPDYNARKIALARAGTELWLGAQVYC